MKFTVRLCRSREELSECVRLQKTVWGYANDEVYPLRLFVNLGRIGGHTLGAFTPGGKLIGFVASMPAWHGSRRYYHSLSLGVLAGYENRGLGRALKWAQRRLAVRSGIRLVEWTFDPLKSKNAFLNIVRLGAVARRYLADYYGEVRSRLQQGLPSDRLVAEWHLMSAHVKRAARGEPPLPVSAATATVEIPPEIERLVRTRPMLARKQQAALRARLQRLFARGLAITGFARDAKGARYILTSYEN